MYVICRKNDINSMWCKGDGERVWFHTEEEAENFLESRDPGSSWYVLKATPQMIRKHQSLQFALERQRQCCRTKHHLENVMGVKLYKSGDKLAVESSCGSEKDFVEDFVQALLSAVNSNEHKDNLSFVMTEWIADAFEIIAAYRGYKTTAHVESRYVCGELVPHGLRHQFSKDNEQELTISTDVG